MPNLRRGPNVLNRTYSSQISPGTLCWEWTADRHDSNEKHPCHCLLLYVYIIYGAIKMNEIAYDQEIYSNGKHKRRIDVMLPRIYRNISEKRLADWLITNCTVQLKQQSMYPPPYLIWLFVSVLLCLSVYLSVFLSVCLSLPFVVSPLSLSTYYIS